MSEWDAVVIGGGPAGLAAATVMAREDLRVVLIPGDAKSDQAHAAGWVGPACAALMQKIDARLTALLDAPVERVTFLSGDGTKSASPRGDRTWCYAVEVGELVDRLTAAARDAGVSVADGRRATGMGAGDEGVQAQHDGGVVQARFAVVATGASADLIGCVGLRDAHSGRRAWYARHTRRIKKTPDDRKTGLSLVVGAVGGADLYSALRMDDRVIGTIFGHGDRADCESAWRQLAGQLGRVTDAPIAPDRALSGQVAYRCPCLELDTHVGKHALVIGAAGGFYAQPSFEGIYPAMWSGVIAGRVVRSAVDAEHPQDALRAFDAAWRMEMGAFIRPPNTDMGLLVPLMFANPTMVDRMAGAIFDGEDF